MFASEVCKEESSELWKDVRLSTFQRMGIAPLQDDVLHNDVAEDGDRDNEPQCNPKPPDAAILGECYVNLPIVTISPYWQAHRLDCFRKHFSKPLPLRKEKDPRRSGKDLEEKSALLYHFHFHSDSTQTGSASNQHAQLTHYSGGRDAKLFWDFFVYDYEM